MKEEKTKKKPDKRKLYNWEKIQVEYFKSDIQAVTPFLKEKYGIDITNNGGAQKRTKGWLEQKIELRKKGLDNAKDKLVELYTPSAEELAEMHRGLAMLAKASIQYMLERSIETDKKTGKQKAKRMPDSMALRRIWEMVKAEKLEPTAVQKNENSMSDDDRSLLGMLLEQNLDDDDDDL